MEVETIKSSELDDKSYLLNAITEYIKVRESKGIKNVNLNSHQTKVAIELIIELSEKFELNVELFMTKRRDRKFCRIRTILALELIRRNYNKSAIALVLLRSHATILHCIKMHKILVEIKDKEYSKYLFLYKGYLFEKGLPKVSIYNYSRSEMLLVI